MIYIFYLLFFVCLLVCGVSSSDNYNSLSVSSTSFTGVDFSDTSSRNGLLGSLLIMQSLLFFVKGFSWRDCLIRFKSGGLKMLSVFGSSSPSPSSLTYSTINIESVLGEFNSCSELSDLSCTDISVAY